MGHNNGRREASTQDEKTHDDGSDHDTVARAARDDLDKLEYELGLTRSSQLKVLNTRHMGRGVFARESIPAGTLIEVSPVLLVSNLEYKQHILEKTIFESYLFTWSRAGDYALALGLGSLFNHSDTAPNVSYVLDKANQCIRYTTKRNIEKNEELCIFYGHGVRFGDKGQLLVGKAADSEDEGEENVLRALSALPDTSEDEDTSGESGYGDEDTLIPIPELPLEFVTGIVAPEDIPLETGESECHSGLVRRTEANLPPPPFS